MLEIRVKCKTLAWLTFVPLCAVTIAILGVRLANSWDYAWLFLLVLSSWVVGMLAEHDRKKP